MEVGDIHSSVRLRACHNNSKNKKNGLNANPGTDNPSRTLKPSYQRSYANQACKNWTLGSVQHGITVQGCLRPPIMYRETIASGDLVIKNSMLRDELRSSQDKCCLIF